MKYWPTKKQWQRWSLPSKLTAIGALLSIISFGTYAIEKSFQISQYFSKSRVSETEQDIAERGTILIELGYSLYAFGLGASEVPEKLDTEKANREIKELYTRLGLSIPEGEFGSETFKATRAELISERDRHFLDIGMHLAAVYGIGLVIIVHGIDYERQAKKAMSDMTNDLKTALRSLGLLAALEQERRIESYLIPESDDTEETYLQTLDALKAEILGEIRRQYGT